MKKPRGLPILLLLGIGLLVMMGQLMSAVPAREGPRQVEPASIGEGLVVGLRRVWLFEPNVGPLNFL
jgi:hypothetical protein